ncbi:MAG TPA: CoA transferase subunit A [Polyangia bacterium]|jgi:3-oxoacid CoA-transferase subunit A
MTTPPASPLASKVYPDAEAALRDLLHDGLRLMSGGFGLSGIAEACIDEIARRAPRDLTIISNNCGNQGQGLAVLLQRKLVRAVICSYVGGNPDLAEQYLAGTIAVELSPQGTFAERIRAGGAGLGGFFTPTGAGTIVAEGKETRMLDGQLQVFETPLRAELAIVRAQVADRFGNARFHRTARNFTPLMATAATVTVLEADQLVEVGAIDPDDVHLPGLYVDRIIHVATHRNAIEFRTTRPRSTP